MAHLSQWRVDIKEEPSLNVPAGVLTKVGLIPPKVESVWKIYHQTINHTEPLLVYNHCGIFYSLN